MIHVLVCFPLQNRCNNGANEETYRVQSEVHQRELAGLQDEEHQLDVMLNFANISYRHMLQSEDEGFVVYNDLRGIDEFKDQTVIIVKAPPETVLEIPPNQSTQVCTSQLPCSILSSQKKLCFTMRTFCRSEWCWRGGLVISDPFSGQNILRTRIR